MSQYMRNRNYNYLLKSINSLLDREKKLPDVVFISNSMVNKISKSVLSNELMVNPDGFFSS